MCTFTVVNIKSIIDATGATHVVGVSFTADANLKASSLFEKKKNVHIRKNFSHIIGAFIGSVRCRYW